MTEPEILPGSIDVETVGGQLSKVTRWTLRQDGRELCRIERINWKWNVLSYRAHITVGAGAYEVTSTRTARELKLVVQDAAGSVIAEESNRQLNYRGTAYHLGGLESPDMVEDQQGIRLLTLGWQMQTLHQIKVEQALPGEFVAVATTVCLLHERPTD